MSHYVAAAIDARMFHENTQTDKVWMDGWMDVGL